MSRREKIEKWEEEIVQIQKNKESYILKSNEKVRELRRKVEEEKRQMKMENDEMIADAVRAVYGEVNEENIELFRQRIMSLAQFESEGADQMKAENMEQ